MSVSHLVATAFVGLCGAMPVCLLADVDVASITGDSSIGAVIGALAGGGFSLWYGWYVTTTTLPRIVKEFRDEADADRKLFREELAAERAARERDLLRIADRLAALGEVIQQKV